MKNIQEYITERLKISSDLKHDYNYFPQTTKELQEIIKTLLDERGADANLNDIDTSKIIDMSHLFGNAYTNKRIKNIDISKWDVSNVQEMSFMFSNCKDFNCDLSHWDVSNSKNMTYMFYNCNNFNSDLSQWDVSKVKILRSMFHNCFEFNSDLSHWNISNVHDMAYMFFMCKKFNSDLSKWDVSNIITIILKLKKSYKILLSN